MRFAPWACAFCNDNRRAFVDEDEPARVADAVVKLGLRHVVITSVDRDDLEDGGAEHFARTIRAIRQVAPETSIEVLDTDFLRKDGALETVVGARPDVFNHNLETVPALYLNIRPGARYFHSLRLLQRVKGLMPACSPNPHYGRAGRDTVMSCRSWTICVPYIDFITIGQYLQSTRKHAAIDRFVTPDEFTPATTAGPAGF